MLSILTIRQNTSILLTLAPGKRSTCRRACYDFGIFRQVQESPYKYDCHVRLIELLRSTDNREMLRESRETMNKYFPLPPG